MAMVMRRCRNCGEPMYISKEDEDEYKACRRCGEQMKIVVDVKLVWV